MLGYRRVTIEFDPCGNSSDSHVYQLKSKPASDLQPAMLCETGLFHKIIFDLIELRTSK